MIFGNPDKFAIYIDIVDSWHSVNDESECISGFYLNGKYNQTNYGLVSFYSEGQSIIEKSIDQIKQRPSLYDETNVCGALKQLLPLRYPNWCADSVVAWEENSDKWVDTPEILDFDLSFESFSKGYNIRNHLFALSKKDSIKLIFYQDDLEHDFYDLQQITSDKVSNVTISLAELSMIFNEFRKFFSSKTDTSS